MAGGTFSERLQHTWAHRRDIGIVWWRALGATGLTRERFHALPRWQQRAGKVALAGVLAFLLSLLVNILEHSFGDNPNASILTFDASAYIAFAIIALLLIPNGEALPALPLRLVLPASVVTAALVGLIVGLTTSNTR